MKLVRWEEMRAWVYTATRLVTESAPWVDSAYQPSSSLIASARMLSMPVQISLPVTAATWKIAEDSKRTYSFQWIGLPCKKISLEFPFNREEEPYLKIANSGAHAHRMDSLSKKTLWRLKTPGQLFEVSTSTPTKKFPQSSKNWRLSGYTSTKKHLLSFHFNHYEETSLKSFLYNLDKQTFLKAPFQPKNYKETYLNLQQLENFQYNLAAKKHLRSSATGKFSISTHKKNIIIASIATTTRKHLWGANNRRSVHFKHKHIWRLHFNLDEDTSRYFQEL